MRKIYIFLKRLQFLILSLSVMLGISMHCFAGVVVGGTRFVYGEKDNAITVDLKNTSDINFLINTKIMLFSGSAAENKEVPFIATPPLFRLSVGHTNKLRIIKTDNTLPADRESLFQLSIAAIPEGGNVPDSVQMAVRSHFKLFYRPAGLPSRPYSASEKLKWYFYNKDLLVKNSSPYYVTFSHLDINGVQAKTAGMIAPYSTLVVPGCNGQLPCTVSGQTVNDYGKIMPEIKFTVTERYHD